MAASTPSIPRYSSIIRGAGAAPGEIRFPNSAAPTARAPNGSRPRARQGPKGSADRPPDCGPLRHSGTISRLSNRNILLISSEALDASCCPSRLRPHSIYKGRGCYQATMYSIAPTTGIVAQHSRRISDYCIKACIRCDVGYPGVDWCGIRWDWVERYLRLTIV